MNMPWVLDRFIKKYDPKADMNEHLGGFTFDMTESTILILGDGRFLDIADNRDSSDEISSLWELHMQGATPYALASMLRERLSQCEILM